MIQLYYSILYYSIGPTLEAILLWFVQSHYLMWSHHLNLNGASVSSSITSGQIIPLTPNKAPKKFCFICPFLLKLVRSFRFNICSFFCLLVYILVYRCFSVSIKDGQAFYGFNILWLLYSDDLYYILIRSSILCLPKPKQKCTFIIVLILIKIKIIHSTVCLSQISHNYFSSE